MTTTDRTGTTNSTDWTVASFHVTENGERTSPARAIERALDDDADAVLADNLASDTPPDQLTIGGPELTTFGDHYLSVTFDAVWNMLDAAHPSTTRTALTFEQSTGAAVDPLSLFTSRDAGLQFLSDWSRPRLLALEGIDPNTDAISAQNVADGTAPTEHNYRTLTLRPDGLMITFGQYQVGPYALGFVGNVVPWSELGSLLRPDAIDPGATRPARYTTGDFFTVPDGFDPPLPAELGRATDPMSTQIAVGDTFFVWLFVTLPDVAEVAILHNDAAAAGWHLDVQGSWPLPCGSVPREVLEPQGIDC